MRMLLVSAPLLLLALLLGVRPAAGVGCAECQMKSVSVNTIACSPSTAPSR